MNLKSADRGRRALSLAGRGVKTVAKAGHATGRIRGKREASGGSRAAAFLLGAGLGAGAGYLLDPQQGTRRRHELRERGLSLLRGGAREAQRQASHAAGKAQGVVAAATPPGRDAAELNDETLKAKVETELFRPADAPKGKVDVNVESHVVYLRGEARSEDEKRDLIERAAAVDGVERAESLLTVAA